MKSIKSKILLSMLTVIALSLLVTGLSAIALGYQGWNKTLERSMTEASKVAAERVSTEIVRYKQLITEAASHPILSGTLMGSAEAAQEANSQLANQDGVLSTDRGYSIDEIRDQLRRIEKEIGFNLVDRATVNGYSLERYTYVLYNEFFSACQETLKPYVGPPHVDKETGRMSVVIAAPIIHNDAFNGVIYGEMGADFLSQIVEEASIGEGSSAFMLDAKGKVIAHIDQTKVVNNENVLQVEDEASSSAVNLPVYQAMTEGGSGFTQYSLEGTDDSYIAYAPIPNTDGWSLGIYLPTEQYNKQIRSNIFAVLGVMAASLLVAAVLSMQVARGIANPIASMARRLEQLTMGDLTTPVEKVKAKDETAVLAEATQDTIDSLNEMIGDVTHNLDQLSKGNLNIRPQVQYKGDFEPIEQSLTEIAVALNQVLEEINRSAEQVSSGAEQVSGGAQALSQGSTEQASSIQQLSASLAEVSHEVQESASNAAKAKGISEQTSALVEQSNRYMEQMLEAMDEISSSATIIGQIIKTIDDIAFQTNILALNAAVEAARAGSAGRGFAVVADEVRNLAEKSAQAAQNTNMYIQQSIEAVENGAGIADETAQSLQSIVEITRQVTELIAEISRASGDQAISIGQVNQGVDQISAVVQTNSATAEQSAASSEELSSQAHLLKSLVGRFTFREEDEQPEQLEEPEQQPAPALEWEEVPEEEQEEEQEQEQPSPDPALDPALDPAPEQDPKPEPTSNPSGKKRSRKKSGSAPQA